MGCICSKERDEHSESMSSKRKESTKPLKRFVSSCTNNEPIASFRRAKDRPHEGAPTTRNTRVIKSVSSVSHFSKMPSSLHVKNTPLVISGWPSWLLAVAGQAISGWVPREANSFEKLDKIGQGTYSSVYRARDLETNKIVALKKVRFSNMDPESVCFMAREIAILRKLDHPNVMKLEGIIASRVSGSLYLVFEYMEHDLSGLLSSHGTNFSEAQIKCYMRQLLEGLAYCHDNGVLHRDIKGSNLLVDNKGILKIADFGLATFYKPNQALTSRVVTLWYRPPELLLGATCYSVGVDLWSTGCILAELFTGKPILQGRTEVEQLHKIFKLCGSPPEDYCKDSKLPHGTVFKPQQPYKPSIREEFNGLPSSTLALLVVLLAVQPERRGTAISALHSDFFKTEPFPLEPSSMPTYPPSKLYDASLRSSRMDSVKGYPGEATSVHSNLHKKISKQGNGTASKLSYGESVHLARNQVSSRTAMDVGSQRAKLGKFSSSVAARGSTSLDCYNGGEAKKLEERRLLNMQHKREIFANRREIHCSGTLMPSGESIEDMLHEHERKIQQAARKACDELSRA